jgi:hypothetical protein
MQLPRQPTAQLLVDAKVEMNRRFRSTEEMSDFFLMDDGRGFTLVGDCEKREDLKKRDLDHQLGNRLRMERRPKHVGAKT